MKKLLILLAIPMLLTGCWSTGPRTTSNDEGGNGGNGEYVDGVDGVDGVDEEDTKDAENVTVSEPAADSTVTFPLKISGEAVGAWYFEGSFPVKLLDSEGNVLAQIQAKAIGDWMQAGLVAFEGTIDIENPPKNGSGKLVFSRDNPSGLPVNEQSFEVAVSFGE